MLDAETGAEPRVDKGVVMRRHDHRMSDRPDIHPPTGQVAVEVAHDLGFRCGMAGALDPHVRAPALAARRRDEVADDVLAADTDRAVGSVAGDELLDLATGLRGVLESRVHLRVDRPLGAVAIGQQPRRGIECIGLKGPDRDPAARRRHTHGQTFSYAQAASRMRLRTDGPGGRIAHSPRRSRIGGSPPKHAVRRPYR